MSPAMRTGLFVVALALGAGLCGYRLHWGLADGVWFHDESIWALRLDPRTPPDLRDVPEVSLVYPTLYELAARAVYTATGTHDATATDAAAIGRAFVGGRGDPQFVSAIAAARTASAIAWLAGIVLIRLAGRRLYGDDVGVIAALLFATSPFAVLQVHSAGVDPLLATIGVLVLLAAAHLAEARSGGAALAAGLAAGLGFATKYTGLAFVAPVAWASIEAARARPRATVAVAALGAAAAIGLVIGTAAGCPRCALHPAQTWDILAWHRRLAATAPFDGNRLAASVGWYAKPWLYQLVASLPYVLGLPVHLLALAGAGVACVRRTRADRVVLALVIPYLAVVGASPSTFPRHLLVLVPPLVLLAARALAALPAARLRWTAVAATVAYSAALAATHVAALGWSQQTAVARFLAARTSAGPTRVAFPTYGPYLRLAEPLADAGLAPEGRTPGAWFTPPARYFVLPHWYATAIRRDRADAALVRDLERLESGTAGYRPILELPAPSYLQRPLDAWLDPALAVDLWQGAIGFTIYEQPAPPR